MPYFTTLISAEELALQIDSCVVVDCRHNLLDRDAGPTAYAAGHIPGAYFLHMDDDLAAHDEPGQGRHPLPGIGEMRDCLASIGLTANKQLVAYDAAGGALAGRLWWLARWIGHEHVAVLDGGLPAWQDANYPLNTEVPARKTGVNYDGLANASGSARAPAVETEQLVTNLLSNQYLVVDARTVERYRGEAEPIDPVAGHIPGAVSRPLQENLRPDGRFKPAPVLREEFAGLLGSRAPASIVHSCGSGVSACHNLLAMEHAGLNGSALYPGSWSAWCADPDRPVGAGTA